MNIRKLNEHVQMILREWQEFESIFAVRLAVNEEDVPKLLEIASKTDNPKQIEATLKSEGIPFSYETTIDEDYFRADSVEKLVSKVESYYEDVYSSVDISINKYDEVEVDDEEVNVGHLNVSLYDDEGYDEEYDDEEYDDEEY